MNFFLINLKETIKAINGMIEKKINIITVKKIREAENIKSSDHSKINFIWRSLKLLAKHGLLDVIQSTSPKKYIMRKEEKIDFNKFLSQIKQRTENLNS